MEGRLVLKRCAVFRAGGPIRADMAIVIERDRIARIAPDEEVPGLPGDWIVSCRGRLAVPGLVDCHAHLVGGQLLPHTGALLLRSPAECAALQRRRDLELTAAEVEVLSAFALARAARSGVTAVAEHLSCPRDALAGLSAEARSADRIGVRLCNSHASSSAEGSDAGVACVDQNAEYVQRPSSALVRPALGFDTAAASDDGLLGRLAEWRRKTKACVHFHLGEDDARATARLADLGLLGAGCVAACAGALGPSEAEPLSASRTLVALEPGGGFEALPARPHLLGLGTGGAGPLWGELASAFAGAVQLARRAHLSDPDGFASHLLFAGPAELCSLWFGAPCGALEEGNLADLALYDLVPVPGEGAPPLLLQLAQARVAWTIVGGRVVLREGELLGNDYVELAREAASALDHIRSSVPA